MNQRLVQLYVQGLSEGWFGGMGNTSGNCPCDFEDKIRDLESTSSLGSSNKRQFNPEYQAALKVLESPLMKALS